MGLLLIILLIAVLLGAAAVLVALGVWLEWTWWPFDQLSTMMSCKGPLEVRASAGGAAVILTLRNLGPNPMKIAAVEGRDASNRRVHPAPSLDGAPDDASADPARRFKQVAALTLAPQESRTITLDRDELVRLRCRALAIRDRHSRAWPADGVDALGLHAPS